MSSPDIPPIPIIPPAWFVANFNAGVRRDAATPQPYRGPLDPLVMHMWSMVSRPVLQPPPAICLLSGI